MNQYDMPSKSLPPALQILNRPMLLISLGLHGLLLVIPTPVQPPAQTLKPEPQPEETVKVSDLLGSTSPPSPKPSPKASKPASKKATSTPRQQVTSRPVISQSQLSRSKQTSKPAAATEPTTNPESTSKTDEESAESATSAAEAEEFQKLFGKLEGRLMKSS